MRNRTDIVAGMLLMLFWVVLMGSCEARAEETKPQIWGTATLFSHHYPYTDAKGRKRQYNERNYGLGFEYPLGKETRLVGGEYRNSFRDTSMYLGVAWMPVHFGQHVHIGLTPAIVTGYTKHQYMPTVMPALAVEDKNLGFNVGVVPCISSERCKIYKVIGFQVKWRFQ
jgi:hypothetical protein